MKKMALLNILLLVAVGGTANVSKYSGGTGEPNDPYRIADGVDLNALAANPDDWDKHFILTADIDLSTTTYTTAVVARDTSGDEGFQGAAFSGTFNGNGHQIINLTIDTGGADADYLGLFGTVDLLGQVKNLGLENVNVTGGDKSYCLGGLVGYNYGGNITHCYSTGAVTGGGSLGGLVGVNLGSISKCHSKGMVTGGGSLGGLVGYNSGGTLKNCYSTGSVTGGYGSHIGGIVGYNSDGTIINCYSTGSVTGGDGSYDLGGLVGYNREGTVSNCYSIGSVSGEDDSWFLGGLVGYNTGSISDCYSRGSVTGEDYLGGIVGYNSDGTIINCYSTGSVTGDDYLGGLVGWGRGAVANSFWDTQTSGQSTSAGGTGKTTTQMQQASAFVGWNGCSQVVWTLDEGSDYPRLSWQDKPGNPLPTEQLSDLVTGAGTESDPYLIYTAEELNMIGSFMCEWDKQFKLMADVNLAGFTGREFNIIGHTSPFTGVFDANNHRIINLTIHTRAAGVCHLGLFGKIGSGGEVKNLGLQNVTVTGGDGSYLLASLVGANAGTMRNCYSTGSITGGYGSRDIGGLVGYNTGSISNCYSTGAVTSGGHSYSLGGLVAENDGGSISNCYSTGSVTAGDRAREVGGLVGSNYGDAISNCYSTGSVSVGDRAREVGGLVGWNLPGKVINSFWDIATSGQDISDGGEAKTTAEMKTKSTFTEAGWDFVEIWDIGENQTYPFLRTHPTGDINHDDKVNFLDLAILASHWLEGTSI